MRPSGDTAMGFDYNGMLDATTGFDHEAQAVFGATDDEGPLTVERDDRADNEAAITIAEQIAC